MRILLDENAPSGLRRILGGHDVRTAPEMGWARYSNGQLLDEAEKAGFEALITGDRSLPFQQNLTARSIAVIIFSTNAWPIHSHPAADGVARGRECLTGALSPLPPFAARDDPRARPPPPASGANHTLGTCTVGRLRVDTVEKRLQYCDIIS
jgi:hypothetical protein